MASILITGCSSGIGYDTAHHLHKSGHFVLASARNIADVNRLQAEGLHAIKLDVTDEKDIHHALLYVNEHFNNRLDILFNNAGFGQPGALEDIPSQALKEQFETNVIGLHNLTRAFIPLMRQQGGGKIIQHSSVLGFISLKYRGAYNASKYAIEALCDTYRLELKGSNIFMISLHTGPIASKFRENAMPHFYHYVEIDKSSHKQAYETELIKRKSEKENDRFTQTSTAVITVIEKILISERPRPFYNITMATKILYLLKKVLPTTLLDAILKRI